MARHRGHEGPLRRKPEATKSATAALTAIPFWIVIEDVFRDPKVGAVVILIFAFVQIVVHMIYFLHMNAKSDEGWTMVALVFTLILVVITLAGSLWVMHHLNVNMMPGHPPPDIT